MFPPGCVLAPLDVIICVCMPRLQEQASPDLPPRSRCVAAAGACGCTRRKPSCAPSAPASSSGRTDKRVLQAIGAYDDVARGAHQATGYETRRNGVNVSFEKINGANRFLLMTMTRQRLFRDHRLGTARRHRDPHELRGGRRQAGGRARAHRRHEARGRPGDRRRRRAVGGARFARHFGRAARSPVGIVRVLVDRAPFMGGDWEHVIDFWAFEPPPPHPLCTCEEGKLYFAMMAPRADKEAATLPIDTSVGRRLPHAPARHRDDR